MNPFASRSKLLSKLLFCLTFFLFSSCSSEQEKTEESVSYRESNRNPFQEGNSKFKNGDFPSAIEFYSRDLDANPANPSSLNNRGLAKSKSGNEEGAIADYNQAIEKKQDYAIAYNNRGFAKIEISDYRGAIEDFTSAIRLKPNYSNALNNRAVANWAVKEKKSACGDWRRAEILGHREAAKSFAKFCN
ncbi:tetratricopeptide repeat protein [Leptospira sp. 201903071]|uniref:tetratricopeptide repeat protein n=1 Tax=Leptospira ainazelensis TaxID=2810034 RepID=UPI00196471A3|nr:tetratricopeptide repeat protein [Leptospira ainazelensis]MBM9500609.1 tetratricopeptide repeat protein [Leptospira ainazelensis]